MDRPEMKKAFRDFCRCFYPAPPKPQEKVTTSKIVDAFIASRLAKQSRPPFEAPDPKKTPRFALARERSEHFPALPAA